MGTQEALADGYLVQNDDATPHFVKVRASSHPHPLSLIPSDETLIQR